MANVNSINIDSTSKSYDSEIKNPRGWKNIQYTLTNGMECSEGGGGSSDFAQEAYHAIIADTANKAIKANQDANGNSIIDTYATKADTYTKSEIDSKISSVFEYKGSVQSYENLPTINNKAGYIYYVIDEQSNYVWDGKNWNKLDSSIDLSEYLKIKDANDTFATKSSLTKETERAILEENNIKNTINKFPAAESISTKSYVDLEVNKEKTRAVLRENEINKRFDNYTISSELPSVKVNNALEANHAESATKDAKGNIIDSTYALNKDIVSESTIDSKILKETNRAKAKENSIENKFNDYTTTKDLPTIKVNNAIKAETAVNSDISTKAIQDENGNNIVNTYATIENTYTKTEVDEKITSVYVYKGSVKTYNDLPKVNQEIGDVYNVEDTDINYAWNGNKWDSLSGTLNLTEYLKKVDADITYAKISDIEGETNRATLRENEIEGKFASYTPTYDLPGIKMDSAINADNAVKATQDSEGNVIVNTYALKTVVDSEIERAKNVESELDGRVSVLETSGGGSGGSGPNMKNYYTKSQTDTEIGKEKTRAMGAEEELLNKFSNYVTKIDAPAIKVNEAIKAETAVKAENSTNSVNALKASQDSKGNIIIDTYATKADTYTKNEVDEKVSTVYKYKGSVKTYSDLPTDKVITGDVYNVEDTDKNYAWTGTKWDSLGGTVNLSEYAKSKDVQATYASKSELNTEVARAKSKETSLEENFSNFTPTVSIPAIKVSNAELADKATKAVQDESGNNIKTTYATIANTYDMAAVDENIRKEASRATLRENAIEGNFINYTTTEKIPLIKVNEAINSENAVKAIQDGNGNIISDTYATIANTYSIEEINDKLSAVYKYKGSVDTYNDLPTENLTIGDVYDVKYNGANYAWDGTEWDELGLKINLTEYLKKVDAESQYASIAKVEEEETRAIAKENEIDAKFANYQLESTALKLKDVTTEVAKEEARALKEEEKLANDILAEANRATTKENDIDAKFASYTPTEAQALIDTEQNRLLSEEIARAKKAEKILEEKIASGGGSSEGLPLDSYYTKTEVDEKLTNEVPGIKVNNAVMADKAIQDGAGNTISTTYAMIKDVATAESIDTKVKVETDRATLKENEIDAKFADYTTTINIPTIKVNNAINADNATKATQDANGKVIADTYATIANTYTKKEIDNKLSAVFKYKGSVPTYSDLPIKKMEIGDVYNVEEDGSNYVWDGKGWDKLSGLIELTDYLKKSEAETIYATIENTNAIDAKFANYTTTAELKNAKVKEAETAVKATQDGMGNNIISTYATKSELLSEADVDLKIGVETDRATGAETGLAARITSLEGKETCTPKEVDDKIKKDVPTIKVNESIKATQDGNGNIISDTYALKDDIVSSVVIDQKIKVETDRATKEETSLGSRIKILEDDTGPDLSIYLTSEDASTTYATKQSVGEVNAKFADYATITSLSNAKVKEAETAIKASQDSNGNSIADTYATIANTYTKSDINEMISSVYKYKGSVPNYESLPKENQTKGDVYNVENTGDNYAWTGTEWDKLGGTVSLGDYLKKDEASTLYVSTGALDTRLENYASTQDVTKKIDSIKTEITDGTIKPSKIIDGAVIVKSNGKEEKVVSENGIVKRAIQDNLGNVINTTYAKDLDLKAEVNRATIAENGLADRLLIVEEGPDLTGYLTTETASTTYATIGSVETVDAKFANYATIEGLATASVGSATKATQDQKGNVIDTFYAPKSDIVSENVIDLKVKSEADRAKGIESGLDGRLTILEGNTGPDLTNYYDKTTIDNKFKEYTPTKDIKTIEVNKSLEATKATQDANGNVIHEMYAKQSSLDLTDAKFSNYTPTNNIHTIVVDQAVKAALDNQGNTIDTFYAKQTALEATDARFADYATISSLADATVKKASQDGNGKVIADTYATIANTYTKDEVDKKVATVYKYQGSVDTFDLLPKKAAKGDVYNVKDTGMNYAWDGTDWDALGGSVNLTNYLKKAEAETIYATINSLNTVDNKFADYTPSTEIHTIKVDESIKATQDGLGNIISDTYIDNKSLTAALADYATTASLADATVAKSGETDSITNMIATEGPWKINFNPKAVTNNPGNFLWFDVKNNQIRNANTKTLNVNHANKATQDNQGNVIYTFYAKDADLTALDTRVTALESGGGSSGGGGTAPDLKDYYKKTETYSQKEVNDAIKVETDRATGAETSLGDRITALEKSGGSSGGGGTSGGGFDFDFPLQKGQGLDLNNPPSNHFFVDAKDWDKITNGPAKDLQSCPKQSFFFMEFKCGTFKLQKIFTLRGNAQTPIEYTRSCIGGQWVIWMKNPFTQW